MNRLSGYAIAYVCLTVSVAALLPPQEFPDRSDVSESALNLDAYSSREWAKSWYTDLPEQLRNSTHSSGFSFKRAISELYLSYSVEKILKADASHAEGDVYVMDFGAGAGYVALPMAEIPKWHVVAVDSAEATLQAGRAQARGRGRTVQFVPSDHHPLPGEDGSLDAVLAFSVLEQIPDLRAAVQEIHRVLKPGGALVFGTVNRTWWSWVTHVLLHERVLKLVPKGLQDWRMFIKPEELKRLLEEEGYGMLHEDLAGLCERPSIRLDTKARPVPVKYEVKYTRCDSLSGHYMAWAYKVKHMDDAEDQLVEDDPKVEL